jgi:serine/threonine protein kinase
MGYLTDLSISDRFEGVFPNSEDIQGYSFRSRLPSGGQGLSLLVTKDGRDYVAKFVCRDGGDDWEKRKRRILEGSEILRGLHYDFLPTQNEVYSNGDWVLTVRDYIPGKTLSEILTEKNFTEREAVDYGIALLRLLNQLHHGSGHSSVVHGDLKPSNIILDPDRNFRIIDFDVARVASDDNHTQTSLGGSMKYQAPERFVGIIDSRSDVYSVGLIMLEMILGEVPSEISIRNYTKEKLKLPDRISPRLRTEIGRMIDLDFEERPFANQKLISRLDNSLEGIMDYSLAKIGIESVGTLQRFGQTPKKLVGAIGSYAKSFWNGFRKGVVSGYKGISSMVVNKNSSSVALSFYNEVSYLNGFGLGGVNHVGGDLKGVGLGGVNHVGGDLNGVGLGGANLIDGSLDGVGLGVLGNGIDGDLKGVGLGVANLIGGDLKGVGLGVVNFSYSDLKGVGLGGVNLISGDLKGVGLGGVNLICGDLKGAGLGGVNLICGDLKGVGLGVLGNGIDGDLKGVGLGGVNAIGGSLDGVSLGLCNFVVKGGKYLQIGLLNFNLSRPWLRGKVTPFIGFGWEDSLEEKLMKESVKQIEMK